MRKGGTEREREREIQWGCVSPQSDRQEVDQQEGGNPLLGWWVTGGSVQGLAGGLGEGQEPWLSKLAVLAFHCRTHRHKEMIHSTFLQHVTLMLLSTQGKYLYREEYQCSRNIRAMWGFFVL